MSTSRYNHHPILPSPITRSVTGLAVALGLVAAAVPAWAGEKAAELAKYFKTQHGYLKRYPEAIADLAIVGCMPEFNC